MSHPRLTEAERARPADPLPAALYQGAVNTWECDEMGHMNVRFYVQRAWEGMAALSAAMRLRAAFRPGTAGAVIPLDQHIRFHREIRAGQPLSQRGGLSAFGETDAEVYQELRHGDGALCATVRTKIAHVDVQQLRPFPWSSASRAAAAGLLCAVPAAGASRSVPFDAPPGPASVAAAEALGVGAIGRGAVSTAEVDAFGRVRPEFFIGRISDAVPNLLAAWRAETAQAAGAGAESAGAAVLEYRLVYRRWPRTGDLIEVRSAVTEVTEKTQRLVHWVLDPLTGEAWATGEAVAVTFDLATRKTIAPPAAQRAALEALRVEGFGV